MYNRENIDPRFIGLHVHHRSVRMLKTHQNDPSFFFTNKTCAPQGEKLGLMNPFPNNSFSWLDNSCISVGAKRYGDLATGVAPGIKSILNSTWHSGGNPRRSSGNTSGSYRLWEHLWCLSLLVSHPPCGLRRHGIPCIDTFGPWCKRWFEGSCLVCHHKWRWFRHLAG